MQGVNYAMYHADLMQCRDYADQVNVGRQVAVAATTGAAVAAVAGASIGNSETAKELAGVGAVAGPRSRAPKAPLHERRRVIDNCPVRPWIPGAELNLGVFPPFSTMKPADVQV